MASTPAEYIQHHLQNLTYGKLPEGYVRADGSVLDQATWTVAQTGAEARPWASWPSTWIPWAGRC